MSKACFSGVSSWPSGWLASAALMPPCAAPEWLRAGVHLAEDRDVEAGRLGLDGGAEPREPAADDDELMVRHPAPQLTQTQRAQMP